MNACPGPVTNSHTGGNQEEPDIAYPLNDVTSIELIGKVRNPVLCQNSALLK